ncbi:peptidylprolyl isomerase [bacterium]|nr:peptidylprolyl isomerase [bacterium]MBU1884009.1 peptidylprolyl isomerase [bacterium]
MKITKNILVNIDYRLSDENDNHLNPGEEELIYLHGGYGHIFQELEDALEGKEVDDTFKVTLTPAQAFGEYKEELIVQEPLSELPEDIYIGMELDTEDDSRVVYVVTNITGDLALLNANHPLAGRTLTFEGKITELQELSDDEAKELLAHEHHDH